MQSFVIEGGRPLSGTVRAAGNKNGALPILAATVLASEPVTLTNVPRIRDVETMVELLADIGADASWTGDNEVRVDPSGVHKTELDTEELRARVDLVAVHPGRERRLLQLLAHRFRLETVQPGRSHEPARVHEARELVAREQHLAQRRIPWQLEVLRV